MKAARLVELKKLEVGNVEKPRCGERDIIIKVIACGICGSDVRMIQYGNDRVKLPAILGHEIAGVVEDIGLSVRGFKKGDRIAMGADVPCNQCVYCRAGQCNNCETNLAIGYQYAGGFAEFIKIDERVWNGGPFHRIPDSMTFSEAALAEPLGCAINGMEILPHSQRNTMMIIGSGVLGSIFAQLAHAWDYRKIVLVDVDSQKLALVKSLSLPVDTYLLFDAILENRIKELTDGRGMNTIIVACGNREAQERSLGMLSKRGSVNLFAGLPRDATPLHVSSNLIHYNELVVTGSHGSTPDQHRRALELIAKGTVRVKQLISREYSLDAIDDALAAVRQPNRFKILINPTIHA